MIAGCSQATDSLAPATQQPAATARAQAKPAQSYTTLYSFSPQPDGNSPDSSLVFSPTTERLYGATYGGGTPGPSPGPCSLGCGTVYSIDPSNPVTEKVVHSFGGNGDGAIPEADLTLAKTGSEEFLYGTTAYGGEKNASSCPHGCGTIFEVSPSGYESVLYSFAGPPQDGATPVGALLMPVNGTFYGVTEYGGAYGLGTIFSWSASGETTVYSFRGGSADGAYPLNNLIDVGGDLYGVTSQGGKGNAGTVFRLTISPPAQERTILSFTAATGNYPVGLDAYSNSTTLYGATSAGGRNQRGTVLALSIAGRIKWVYSFKNDPDGAFPEAQPRLYDDAIYGTTHGGGEKGLGSIYRIEITGKGECVLHSFGANGDGFWPVATLRRWTIAGTSRFYGTALAGGANGLGSVFAIAPTAC